MKSKKEKEYPVGKTVYAVTKKSENEGGETQKRVWGGDKGSAAKKGEGDEDLGE